MSPRQSVLLAASVQTHIQLVVTLNLWCAVTDLSLLRHCNIHIPRTTWCLYLHTPLLWKLSMVNNKFWLIVITYTAELKLSFLSKISNSCLFPSFMRHLVKHIYIAFTFSLENDWLCWHVYQCVTVQLVVLYHFVFLFYSCGCISLQHVVIYTRQICSFRCRCLSWM